MAAGSIFFSYIGLDAVSTAGDEVKDPQHTMPRAIIAALLIVTTVYVLVALAALGAQPWEEFGDQKAGLAVILDNITGNIAGSTILAAGAVISIFSVTLVVMYGQTRILFAMGRDGLLPSVFAKVSPRTMTPVTNTVIVAIVVAILAGFLPLDYLADMVSIGTLTAFIVVSIGVIILEGARAGSAPRVQGSALPGHAGPVDRGLRLHPFQAALAHVDRVQCVGGGRADLLPGVEPPPQRAQRRRRRCDPNGRRRRRRRRGRHTAEGTVMTVVVGYLAGKGGLAPLHLAVEAARTLKTSLTVATIVPKPWTTPSLAKIDAEYAKWAEQLAADSAREAQRYLGALARGLQVSYQNWAHRSVSGGLIEVLEPVDADVLVLGSSANGQLGQVVVEAGPAPGRTCRGRRGRPSRRPPRQRAGRDAGGPAPAGAARAHGGDQHGVVARVEGAQVEHGATALHPGEHGGVAEPQRLGPGLGQRHGPALQRQRGRGAAADATERRHDLGRDAGPGQVRRDRVAAPLQRGRADLERGDGRRRGAAQRSPRGRPG